MSAAKSPVRIVLIGLGHTHLHILKEWRRRPIDSAALICISNQADAAYSGMLPGVLAGNYPPSAMKIDLNQRCKSVGASLILGETENIDLHERSVSIAGQAPLAFDWLSVGVGSRPAKIEGDNGAISIKPMQTFLTRLAAAIEQQISHSKTDRPLRIVVIGGGAGGVEVSLCLDGWLRSQLGSREYSLSIVHRGAHLLAGGNPRAIRIVTKLLHSRGVEILLNHEAQKISKEGIFAKERNKREEFVPADIVISAVGATAPPILDTLRIPKDRRGFILTSPTLQSVTESRLFAVGDSGTIQNHAVAKAGVYAVRQGPILMNNLRCASNNQPLKKFKPQADFLWLLNTGDHRAILQYKRLALQGRWCWWLKHWIDTRFIRQHQQYAN